MNKTVKIILLVIALLLTIYLNIFVVGPKISMFSEFPWECVAFLLMLIEVVIACSISLAAFSSKEK